MIISTIENKAWYENKSVDQKGIELKIVEERQKIRGFGTCFSELGALALDCLEKSDRDAFLSELFDEDKCNFNYCRTPMGASDFSVDHFSYNETDGDYEMKDFSIERDRKLLLPLIFEALKSRRK